MYIKQKLVIIKKGYKMNKKVNVEFNEIVEDLNQELINITVDDKDEYIIGKTDIIRKILDECKKIESITNIFDDKVISCRNFSKNWHDYAMLKKLEFIVNDFDYKYLENQIEGNFTERFNQGYYDVIKTVQQDIINGQDNLLEIYKIKLENDINNNNYDKTEVIKEIAFFIKEEKMTDAFIYALRCLDATEIETSIKELIALWQNSLDDDMMMMLILNIGNAIKEFQDSLIGFTYLPELILAIGGSNISQAKFLCIDEADLFNDEVIKWIFDLIPFDTFEDVIDYAIDANGIETLLNELEL